MDRGAHAQTPPPPCGSGFGCLGQGPEKSCCLLSLFLSVCVSHMHEQTPRLRVCVCIWVRVRVRVYLAHMHRQNPSVCGSVSVSGFGFGSVSVCLTCTDKTPSFAGPCLYLGSWACGSGPWGLGEGSSSSLSSTLLLFYLPILFYSFFTFA